MSESDRNYAKKSMTANIASVAHLNPLTCFLHMQRSRVSLFHRLPQQIQQICPSCGRLFHFLRIVHGYCYDFFAVIEAPETDPDSCPVAGDAIEPVTNAQLMYESCSIDAQTNTGAYFFVLRCLLVDVYLDARTRAGIGAMVVNRESAEKTAYATSNYCDAERLIAGFGDHLTLLNVYFTTRKATEIEIVCIVSGCMHLYSSSLNLTMTADYCRQTYEHQADNMLLPVAACSEERRRLVDPMAERFYRHLNQPKCPTLVARSLENCPADIMHCTKVLSIAEDSFASQRPLVLKSDRYSK